MNTLSLVEKRYLLLVVESCGNVITTRVPTEHEISPPKLPSPSFVVVSLHLTTERDLLFLRETLSLSFIVLSTKESDSRQRISRGRNKTSFYRDRELSVEKIFVSLKLSFMLFRYLYLLHRVSRFVVERNEQIFFIINIDEILTFVGWRRIESLLQAWEEVNISILFR